MKPNPARRKHSRRSSARDGFTLVELLVVITIIVTLAALSVMGLGKIKESAMMAKSTANLRQIHSFAMMYSGDNNQKLLPGKGSDMQQWQTLLARYTGKDFTGIWEFVDQNKGFKPEVDAFVATGWLKAPAYDKNRYWQTGYGMNMLPGLPQDNSANTNESPDWGKSFHMSRITGQSVRAFILTWPEWNAYYSDTSLAKAAFVGKKVNVLFFDGHVEAKRPDEIRPLFEVPLKRAQ